MGLFKRKSRVEDETKPEPRDAVKEMREAQKRKWNSYGIRNFMQSTYLDENTGQDKQVVTFVSAIGLTSKAIGNTDKVIRILKEADQELQKNGGSYANIYTSLDRNYYVLVQSHPAEQEVAEKIALNFAFIKDSITDKLKNEGFLQDFDSNGMTIEHLAYMPLMPIEEVTFKQPQSNYALFKADLLRF